MNADKVLEIVLREMVAYGDGWRHNWSHFDGRTLRHQLDTLETWATKALAGTASTDDFTAGSDFYKEQAE